MSNDSIRNEYSPAGKLNARDMRDGARYGLLDSIVDGAAAGIATAAIAADPQDAGGITIGAFLARWLVAQLLRLIALWLTDNRPKPFQDGGIIDKVLPKPEPRKESFRQRIRRWIG